MRKQIDSEIFGIKLKLSERSTQEVYNLTAFTLSLLEPDKDGVLGLSRINGAKVSTLLIYQSLNYWIDEKNIFLRWYYHRKLSVKNLSKGLTPREIAEFADKVNILDGNDPKKKVVAESQSEET